MWLITPLAFLLRTGDPWASPAGNRMLVDVKIGCFGGCAVETADWAASATAPGAAQIAKFTSGSKSSTDLSPSGLSAINRSGITQVKLRFEGNQSSTAYIFLNKDTQATLTVEYQ